MIQKKRAAITQMSFLFVLQWLSIATIILNALALSSAKSSNQGLIVASEFGPQDYTLLIIGAVSLLASSLLLITYLHIFLRLLGDRPLTLSKRILASEIVITLIVIAFWSTASGIIVTRFNAFSVCKKPSSTLSKISLSSKPCSLVNAMFVVGFVAIVVWFVILLVSIYSLYVLNHGSVGGLFSLQAPVHPSEDVKVKTNRVGDSHAYKQSPAVVEGTITKYESVVTTVEIEKAVSTNEGEKIEIQQQPQPQQQQQQQQQQQHQQQQQQQKRGSSKIIVIEDLQQNQLQELKPVKTMRSWNFDFSFEPIQLDLMLPSKSELIGSKKKKICESNLYPSYP